MPSYRTNIQHIQSGEDVSAGVSSRPDRQLEGNLRYLKDLFEAASLGEALIARSQTVEETAAVGQAVYYNRTTQQFERALAAATPDSESGTLIAADSADVVGVVLSKTNATLADILLLGRAELDLTQAVSGTPAAGRYWLSSQTPGHLVQHAPAVSIPVLYYDGTSAFVQPDGSSFLNDHIHYRFELVNRPAGSHVPPDLGDPLEEHEITDADSDLPGWLPADDPIFDGAAPAGARFGYNLSQHPELLALWPPVPLEAAQIVLDRPYIPDTQVRFGGVLALPHTSESPGDYVIDANGIWWMRSCAGVVPWDPELDTSSSLSAPHASESEDCGLVTLQRCFLSFALSVFNTESRVVTELTAEEGTPIEILDCDGNPASTGKLQLRLRLALEDEDSDELAGKVFKDLDGQQLKKGWVVEGIVAGNGLIVESTHQRIAGDDTVHQGTMTLSVETNPGGNELPVQLVRMDRTAERFYQDIPYIAMEALRDSSIRLKIQIPPTGLPGAPGLKLRLWVLGRGTGTLPALTASYRRLTRPTGGDSEDLPLSDTALTIATNVATDSTNDYVEVDSDPFAIQPGELVFITIERSDSDGYAGEIGLLRMSGIVVAI